MSKLKTPAKNEEILKRLKTTPSEEIDFNSLVKEFSLDELEEFLDKFVADESSLKDISSNNILAENFLNMVTYIYLTKQKNLRDSFTHTQRSFSDSEKRKQPSEYNLNLVRFIESIDVPAKNLSLS